MATIRKRKRLLDACGFAGFRPLELVRGVFGDSSARVIPPVRPSKKRSARDVAEHILAGTTARHGASAICPAATRGSIWSSRFAGFSVDVAAKGKGNDS